MKILSLELKVREIFANILRLSMSQFFIHDKLGVPALNGKFNAFMTDTFFLLLIITKEDFLKSFLGRPHRKYSQSQIPRFAEFIFNCLKTAGF